MPPAPDALADFAAHLRPWLDANHHGAATDFNALALDLFARQFAANAIYRRLCETAGRTPERITDWTQIPAVPTVAFKELELTSIPPAARTAVFHSSGTTEQRPSRHFHHADSLALYEASLGAWFPPHVSRGETLPFLSLTPPPAAAPHSSLVHMLTHVGATLGGADSEFFGRVGRDQAWELDFTRLDARLEAAVRTGQPVVLLGTAFNFVHLLDDLAARQRTVRLPSGSRVMETGGYKGRSRVLSREALHDGLTRALGIPGSQIICEYGMSELSSQAYRTPSGTAGTPLFRFPPWARVLAISPETGRLVPHEEPGLLRVIDLANVWSVLAVQTEDLGVIREPSTGGFELVGRAPRAEPRGCSLMPAA